jgi:replicative DNA helicase
MEFDAARSGVSGRVPPSDVEAEKAVLSALLLDNDAIHTVLSEIRPEDFYHPAHQKIYESMLLMQDANEPVDLHTLSNFMNAKKTLDAIGGPVYLAEIGDYEATAANVLHHARIVRDKSMTWRRARSSRSASSGARRPSSRSTKR